MATTLGRDYFKLIRNTRIGIRFFFVFQQAG
jgi:hypothetical protein